MTLISYHGYKLIHLLSVFVVLVALGALWKHALGGGGKETNEHHKMLAMMHGIGLFGVILGGFGSLAATGMHSLPLWVWIKLLCWVGLGGSMTLLYKKPDQAKAIGGGIIALAMLAAMSAIWKFGQ